MMREQTRQFIEQFWQAMNTNDWSAASALLHEECVLEYPQSGERFRGREAFIALNGKYPVVGPWRFDVQRIIAEEREAVSAVTVTAPTITALVVSFFEVRDSTIWHITEYWPEAFDAPTWRAQWAEHQ